MATNMIITALTIAPAVAGGCGVEQGLFGLVPPRWASVIPSALCHPVGPV
ncbi:hypothetical protein [Phaeobacter italicus]|nr:hypothetical protein [Phaeobacter italicus]MCA0856995.1 hypothetical protein [Phaeobacter italicus]